MPSLLGNSLAGIATCLATVGAAAAGDGESRRTLTTEHFILQANGTQDALEGLGRRCEALRDELRAKWFDAGAADVAWTPRCTLVVHATAKSYQGDVPGGEQTLGSSWIEFEADRIVTRQIDVRGDRSDWFEEALAHELTHVLLADRFIDAPMPRWAEEGLALLADSPRKQAGHEADFRRAYTRRGHYRVVELVSLEEYPSDRQITTFYGQSASLVRFLTARGRPSQFVGFVQRATTDGYDAALRTVYDIDGLAALESAWLGSLRQAPQLAAE
jgi:hypothetical protein